MKTAKTLTHILFPILLGLIIGGAISGNSSLLIWGIVLIVLDIIIGIALQYSIDKKYQKNDDWNNLSFEEKRKIAHDSVEQAKQNMRNQGIDIDGELEKFCDEFNREHHLGKYSKENSQKDSINKQEEFCYKLDTLYEKLKINGGARFVDNINNDDAGKFLLEICDFIPHAPLPHTLARLYVVSIEDLNGACSIVYTFEYIQNSICQNVFIFLVHTKNDKIRLFAVETDFSAFCLCEYSGNSHLNYGQVELKNVPNRIKEILNS